MHVMVMNKETPSNYNGFIERQWRLCETPLDVCTYTFTCTVKYITTKFPIHQSMITPAVINMACRNFDYYDWYLNQSKALYPRYTCDITKPLKLKSIYTIKSRQNGRLLCRRNFQIIILCVKTLEVRFSIAPKFVPKDPSNNKPVIYSFVGASYFKYITRNYNCKKCEWSLDAHIYIISVGLRQL